MQRRQDQIDAEAALDGFYVLRTPVPAGELDAPAVVAAYKNLKYVERDFRHIKSDDLDLRPVFHRLEEHVWTPTGLVDTIRSGTMVYEERTGRGTGSQEVHPGI